MYICNSIESESSQQKIINQRKKKTIKIFEE